MQIRDNSVVAQSEGLQEGRQFSIKMDARAFDILSASLYSDRLLAPIRELIANAYDASKENMLVTLPTALMPIFSVRDYGPGLSHEDALVLYTTYFESTKNNDNNSIGGFGLGSKSPFAYVDQFTVDSVFKEPDGKHVLRNYVCFRDKGVPQISKVFEAETQEKTGLKVSFAVKKEDVYTFEKKYRELIRFFPFTPAGPKMAPVTQIKLWDDIFHCPETFNGGYTNTGRYHTPNLWARMGIISYPLNVTQVNSITNKHFDVGVLFPKNDVIIDFPIGSLSLSPSRETLSYDKGTLTAIFDKLSAYREFCLKTIKDTIKATPAKTFKEKIALHNKLSASVPNYYHLDRSLEPAGSEELLNLGSNKGASLRDGETDFKVTHRYNLTHRDNGTDIRYISTWPHPKKPTNPNDPVPSLNVTELDRPTIMAKFLSAHLGTTVSSIKVEPKWNRPRLYPRVGAPPEVTEISLTDGADSFAILGIRDPKLKSIKARADLATANLPTNGYRDHKMLFVTPDPAKVYDFLAERLFLGNPSKDRRLHQCWLDDVVLPTTGTTGSTKPAACFEWNKQGWQDVHVEIKEYPGEEYFFTLSENREIAFINYAGMHALLAIRKGGRFFAFPKSRYDTLRRQALAAKWIDLKDLQFGPLDLQLLSDTVHFNEKNVSRTYVIELVEKLSKMGTTIPKEWKDLLAHVQTSGVSRGLTWGGTADVLKLFGLTLPPPKVIIDEAGLKKILGPMGQRWLPLFLMSRTSWNDAMIEDVFKG